MRYFPLAIAVAACALPACIIDNTPPPPDPIGSFAFDWSFAGETDCATAGVTDLDIVLSQGGEVVFEQDHEACFGGGLTIAEIDSGSYDADIVAFDHNGDAAYQASFSVDVPDDHRTNNVGLIAFEAVGNPPPPPPSQGTLSFFWAFHYPTDAQTVEDCALAGVDSVDVTVTPTGGESTPFSQTSVCDATHQGLDISSLDAGNYTLRLVAHGSFQGNDVVLYDSGDVPTSVNADSTNDLGNIVLGRVSAGFSDFNVSWAFGDSTTCATNGASTVTLSFERDGQSSPEDTFDVDCTAANVVRRTFVPGHYTVTGVANGSSATYAASVGVDLPPNDVAEVDLSLTPG